MKKYIKRLFFDSAAFSVATMGNKLVAALLFPIYVTHLPKGDIADWGLTNTIVLILTYLCMLGTDTAMAFYFYDAKTKEERKVYFSNAIIFSVSVCAIFAALSYVFGSQLISVIYVTKNDYHLLLPIAFSATIGAIIIQHILGYARYDRRVWLFNIFSMCYVIGSNLVSIYFLVVLKAGVIGIFYGQLIGQSTIAIVLLFIFRKEIVFKLSKKHLSNLIHYGAPLLPTLIAFWVMSSVSRPIIYHLASKSSADIYEACVRLASIIVLITSPFQLAWRPFSMSIKDREDAPQLFGLVGRLLLIIGTLAILLLSFFIQPLYDWFAQVDDKPYLSSGYLYVWALSLGTLFNVLHSVFGVGLLIKKQTKIMSRGFFIAALVYLIGNVILVPIFHIWGAVSMTVVAYLIVILWVYTQNQKVYPIEFQFKSIMTYLGIFLLIMAGISWIQSNQLAHLWMYYIIAMILTVTVALLTGLIPINLLDRLKRFLPTLGGKG